MKLTRAFIQKIIKKYENNNKILGVFQAEASETILRLKNIKLDTQIEEILNENEAYCLINLLLEEKYQNNSKSDPLAIAALREIVNELGDFWKLCEVFFLNKNCFTFVLNKEIKDISISIELFEEIYKLKDDAKKLIIFFKECPLDCLIIDQSNAPLIKWSENLTLIKNTVVEYLTFKNEAEISDKDFINLIKNKEETELFILKCKLYNESKDKNEILESIKLFCKNFLDCIDHSIYNLNLGFVKDIVTTIDPELLIEALFFSIDQERSINEKILVMSDLEKVSSNILGDDKRFMFFIGAFEVFSKIREGDFTKKILEISPLIDDEKKNIAFIVDELKKLSDKLPKYSDSINQYILHIKLLTDNLNDAAKNKEREEFAMLLAQKGSNNKLAQVYTSLEFKFTFLSKKQSPADLDQNNNNNTLQKYSINHPKPLLKQ